MFIWIHLMLDWARRMCLDSKLFQTFSENLLVLTSILNCNSRKCHFKQIVFQTSMDNIKKVVISSGIQCLWWFINILSLKITLLQS